MKKDYPSKIGGYLSPLGTMETDGIYLLIGGNRGNRGDFMALAKQRLEANCGRLVAESSIYQTAAWGLTEQPNFLNQVLQLQTQLSPKELLHCILSIETSLGRERDIKYGPRTIDIDILFYNSEVIEEEGLTVPHPRLQDRRFVLVPLAELNPDFVHPVLRKTVAQLLADCSDDLAVEKFD